jgi:hypothetical protein
MTTGAWADELQTSYTTNARIENAVTVSADMDITIASGVFVSLEKGLTIASGKTLTVRGGGTLAAYGTNGSNGLPGTTAIVGDIIVKGATIEANGGWGDNGTPGSDNFSGDGGNGNPGTQGGVAINGAVTIYSGSITAKGGQGGQGGRGGDGDGGDGGQGGNGGNGADAITGTLTFYGGSVTAIGGNGGAGGRGGEGSMEGGNGSAGTAGKAFASTLTIEASTYTMTDGSAAITDATGKQKVVLSAADTTDPNDVEVTTNAAEAGTAFTEATFTMPANDVTVDYELVRDMQDATNPVAFSGIPADGKLFVKKGNDGKYQPAEALNIQLIDPLAATDAQNIIASTKDVTIYVLVGDDSTGPIVYDDANPITLEAFLADTQPGYYWIKAVGTADGAYDGTVYSTEMILTEAYDLTLSPAQHDKLQGVTVDGQAATPDTDGVIKNIAPGKKVTITTTGPDYIIRKATVTKTVNMLYIEASNHKLYYIEGETWRQAIDNHADVNQGWQYGGMEVWFGNIVNVLKGNGAAVDPGSVIDPTKTYTL